jgi:hypothetical protein
MALGDMFKREDFPSVDAVKSKFAFQVNYLPVPTAGDFRIDVGNDATKELQDRFAKFATERVDAAMQDVRTRLKEHLTRMSDRLTVDVVGSEAKPRMFHETLLDTAFELCDIVKSLNLVGDPALEKARKSLEEAICGITTQELRKDTSVRKGVKEEVDAILKNLSW